MQKIKVSTQEKFMEAQAPQSFFRKCLPLLILAYGLLSFAEQEADLLGHFKFAKVPAPLSQKAYVLTTQRVWDKLQDEIKTFKSDLAKRAENANITLENALCNSKTPSRFFLNAQQLKVKTPQDLGLNPANDQMDIERFESMKKTFNEICGDPAKLSKRYNGNSRKLNEKIAGLVAEATYFMTEYNEKRKIIALQFEKSLQEATSVYLKQRRLEESEVEQSEISPEVQMEMAIMNLMGQKPKMDSGDARILNIDRFANTNPQQVSSPALDSKITPGAEPEDQVQAGKPDTGENAL
jgi:hypothetical protein